jgi:sulfur carrier protein
VKINGKDINLKGDKTIRDLLLELKIKENRVVVELNREIVAKEDYSNINLKDDDTIEVISFVGGG